MANYLSRFTGQEIDNAIEKTNGMPAAVEVTTAVDKSKAIPSAESINESINKTSAIPTAVDITESVTKSKAIPEADELENSLKKTDWIPSYLGEQNSSLVVDGQKLIWKKLGSASVVYKHTVTINLTNGDQLTCQILNGIPNEYTAASLYEYLTRAGGISIANIGFDSMQTTSPILLGFVELGVSNRMYVIKFAPKVPGVDMSTTTAEMLVTAYTSNIASISDTVTVL